MSRLIIVEVPSYSSEFKGIREVRELVCCKDCRYWDGVLCCRVGGLYAPDAQDYCSLAELKEQIDKFPSADRPRREWHNGFYDFLWNVINPNEMQKYIEIYEAQPIAVNGAQMKGADDDWTTQACIEIGR